MPVSLYQMRELLLPGLWGIAQQYQKERDWVDLHVDLHVDHALDKIEIEGAVEGKVKRETLFTRSEIENESYKRTFGDRVKDFLGITEV